MTDNKAVQPLREGGKVGDIRWYDRMEVRVMAALLLFFFSTTMALGGWVGNKALNNEAKNVEQDGRIRAIEQNWEMIQRKLDKIDDKLDAMKNPK